MSYCTNDITEVNKNSKRVFDKKKWREQKYSGRAKVHEWDRMKRMQIQRQCIKEYKKLKLNFTPTRENAKHNTSKTYNTLKEAQLQHKRIQKMNGEKWKEQERIKKEKSEALKAYKEVKVAKFKKLCKKTKKGQPLMRGRMELLLEKIQKNYISNKT